MRNVIKLALSFLKSNQDDECVQEEMEEAGITVQQLEQANDDFDQTIEKLLAHFTPDGQPFTKDGFYEVLEQSVADYDWQKGVFRALERLAETSTTR